MLQLENRQKYTHKEYSNREGSGYEEDINKYSMF